MEPEHPVSAPPGFGPRGATNPPPGFANAPSKNESNRKSENVAASEPSQRDTTTTSGHGEDRRGRGRGGGGRGGRNNQPQGNNNKKEQDTSRGGKSGRGGSRGGSGGGGNNRRGQPKPKLQNIGDTYSGSSAASPADDGASSATESLDMDDDISVSSAPPAEDALPDDWPVCLTCCEPIRWFCVGACNHSEVCAMCCIRMRKLYDDKDCCICKKPLDRVIVTKEKDKKFEELDEQLKEVPLLLTQKIDGANTYFLDGQYFKTVSTLFDVLCPKCGEKFPSISSLSQHMNRLHNHLYCDLCLKHRKVFISEQVLYSSASQLHKHEERGDPSLKLKPHPMCKYCDVRFFSDEELFRHCEESHFKCWICERNNVLFNYFRDYKHLEEHFDNKHFLCSDKECLEKKFVVFRTQFELQAHEVSAHLGKKGLSKAESLAARTVQLNFSVRGSTQASTSSDLADASQYQQQQQAMYQSRIAGSNNGRMTRPAEVPVFFPDDRRRNTHSRSDDSQPPPPPENYNAQDTGFNLSERLAASASKPSTPAASSSSAPAASSGAQVSTLTPQERSKNLIAKIKAFLGSDAKFTEFRRLSAMFKQSQLAPPHYYAQFLKNFGESQESYSLFEEMVDLLPDVKKQQALLEMHRKHQRLSSEFPALGISGGSAVTSPVTSSGRSHWSGAAARSTPAAAAPAPSSRAPPKSEDFPSLGGATEAFPALGSSSAAGGSSAAPSWPAAPGNRNQGVTYNAGGGKQKGKKVLLRYG